MRRVIAYFSAWLGVGLLALVVAMAAVSTVGRQVMSDRPSPLNRADVQTELRTTTSATASSPLTTGETLAPVDDPSGATASSKPPPADQGAAPSATTTPPAAPAETRTYVLVGGTATLRLAPSGVTVLEATPNPGYAVEVDHVHGNGIRVEFRDDEHRSRVDAWWDAGPRDEVRED